jgi:cobaltochelatase CobS
MLGSAGMDDIDTIVRNREKTEAALANLTNEFSEMKRKMATMHVSKGGSVAKVSASGELPSGGATWRNANEVLKEKGIRVPDSRKHMFQFEVPFFEWDSEHRDVPQQDEAYRWRWDVLAKLMWGLAFDKKPWVWGHTGTGKTTLVEQVCSILNWPFVRVNFDSEITRMDLIGKDGLTTDEHGNTISYFKDGILPQAMSQPTVICNDELDFVRPDIAYVYQRALEGNGLLLTEDAGRLIRPHEYNRMVATANTQGQGDEFGLYQGARVQSQAFLDRFQCWVEVGYLNATDEKKLVQARVPSLAEDMVDRLIKYVREHREAFKQAAILKPLSPRGVISTAEAIAFFTSLHPKAKEGEAVRMAIEATVLGSVTHADAAKINELVDRTFN